MSSPVQPGTSVSYMDLFAVVTPEVPRDVLMAEAAAAAGAGLDKVAAHWWWRVVNQHVTDSITRIPARSFTVDEPSRHTRAVPAWDRLPYAAQADAASTAVSVWAGWPAPSGNGRRYGESLRIQMNGVPQQMWASVEALVPWTDLFPQTSVRVQGFVRDLAVLRDTVSFEEARGLREIFAWSSPGKIAQWARQVLDAGGRLDDLRVWARTDDFIGAGNSSKGFVYVPDWAAIRGRYEDASTVGMVAGFAPMAAAAGYTREQACEAARNGDDVAQLEFLAGFQNPPPPLTQGILV